MKKILLSLILSGYLLVARSQTVLNETYCEPGSGNSEFIELYNSSTTGSQNLDCFTILTYWSSGSNKGWYVIDLPNTTVVSKGWYVLASATPFNVQSQSGIVANLNWNALSFRNGSTGGYLKKYQVSGATYTDLGLADATAVTDLMVDGDFYSGHNYMTLLFQNGVMINGFWGGGPDPGTLPAGITGLPNLSITPNASCGSAFTVNFSSMGAVENVNQSGGSDNGYARSSDGKCGAWVKTSSSVNHTPGITNGGAAGAAGSLTTSQLLVCNTGPGVSRIDYNITAVTGTATEADDFPVEVQLYYDFGTIGALDGADVYQSSLFDALISDPAKSFTISQIQPAILVYKTKRGCFDKVVSLVNGCLPLPVQIISFTASRNRSNVSLKWTTMTEQNNSGFAIERNLNGSWEQVGFVASQAPGGNSADLLNYNYSDINTNRGITQYRIRQTDINGRSRYSEIRTVRGESQSGGVIVYSNPSIDGKVNLSFEDASASRDITVSDMNGRMVKQLKSITASSVTIESLLPGIYSIRVFVPSTGEQFVQKIVVNRR